MFPMRKVDYYDIYFVAVPMFKALSYERFCNLWALEYPKLKLPKRQRIGHCKVCADLISRLKRKMTAEEKEQIIKERDEHWAKVLEMNLQICDRS